MALKNLLEREVVLEEQLEVAKQSLCVARLNLELANGRVNDTQDQLHDCRIRIGKAVLMYPKHQQNKEKQNEE